MAIIKIKPKKITFDADQNSADNLAIIGRHMFPCTQQAAIYHAVRFYAQAIDLGLLDSITRAMEHAASKRAPAAAAMAVAPDAYEKPDAMGNFPSDYVEMAE